MYPRDTVYRLAARPQDFKLCHALAKKAQMNGHISYCPPTVMAFRDGGVIAVLASHRRNGHLIAGPLISPSPFVTMRLIEIYEAAAKEIGHRYYLFAVPQSGALPKGRKRYLQEVEDLFGIKPVAEDEDSVWFRRAI